MSDADSAGALLRKARGRAGLSQSELARRAGVAQSVISVYESGHRQPSLATLSNLVAATGAALEVKVSPGPTAETVPLADRVVAQAREIEAAAAEFGIEVIGMFGSVARREDGPDSDLDLLIDVPPGVGLFALGRLEDRLRTVIGVDVDIDLVPQTGLRPRVRDNVLRDLIALQPSPAA